MISDEFFKPNLELPIVDFDDKNIEKVKKIADSMLRGMSPSDFAIVDDKGRRLEKYMSPLKHAPGPLLISMGWQEFALPNAVRLAFVKFIDLFAGYFILCTYGKQFNADGSFHSANMTVLMSPLARDIAAKWMSENDGEAEESVN